MKRTWIAVLALAVAVSFSVAAASIGQEKKAEAVNDKCPLTGKDIDKEKSSEVKVKLCCKDCKKDWDKDPAASLAKITKLPNAKCPVTGEDAADTEVSATVSFCCGNCKGKFDKDSAPYLKAVKAKAKK